MLAVKQSNFKPSIFIVGLLASLTVTVVNAKRQPVTGCTLISGQLVKLSHHPLFKFNPARNYTLNAYPMSHTQFFVRNGNGQVYKVVLDNLYYEYLSAAQASSNRDVGIIADFKRRFPVGSMVDVCGKLFKQQGRTGIHFVHPSACSATQFNGFLRINGDEISNNINYCANCGCRLSW